MKKNLLLLSCFLINCLSISQNNLQFAKRIGGTQPLQNDGIFIKSMFADTDGNTYSYGFYYGTIDFDPSNAELLRTADETDAFVLKLDSSGNVLWLQTQTVPGHQEIGAAILNTGSVFAHGLAIAYQEGNSSFSMRQLNLTTGETIFISPLYTATEYIAINCIAVVNSATATNYYLGGSFVGDLTIGSTTAIGHGSNDALCINFRTTTVVDPFKYRWFNYYGGGMNDQITGIEATANSLHMVGYFYGTADFDGNPDTNNISKTATGLRDGFYMVASSGNGRPAGAANVIAIGGTGNDAVNSITGEAGAYYLCGYFSDVVDFDQTATTNSKTALGDTDGFVARYNNSIPSLAWVNTQGTNLEDTVNDITIAPATSKLFYCGVSGYKDISMGSCFLDGSANNAFGGILASNGFSVNSPTAITFGNGNVYTAGVYNGTIDFDPGPGVVELEPLNGFSNDSAFISKMSNCGESAITPVINVNASICVGQEIMLSVENPNLRNNDQWKWYSGSCGGTLVGTGVNLTLSPTVTTSYYVRAEGGCAANSNCSDVRTVTVNPLPDDGITHDNVTLTATEANGFYQWIDCNTNQIIPGAVTRNFTPTGSGNYAVLVSNIYDCSVQSACVPFNGLTNETFEKDGFAVYPNPVKEMLQIDYKSQLSSYKIFSTLGQLVLEGNQLTNNSIDFSAMESGMYYLQLSDGSKTVVFKIVKE